MAFNDVEPVKLTDCIGPAFYDVHWDLQQGLHTYYDLKGGRGSLKSSFISIEIILGIMQDKNANALIYRKVADTIESSIYEQILWAIDKLGVYDKFHCTKSPYRCTYIPTGQQILFKGLDKAKKSKSIKVARGYIKYLWFEELDEFSGPEEIRSVQQSVLRGGSKFVVFKSFNPPKNRINWANKEVELDRLRSNVLVSETTYLQAPKEWLGQQFIDDAEWLKDMQPNVYRHEYLGESTDTGTLVFDNIEARQLDENEIKYFDNIYMGVDWGWYPDPFHWSKCYYQPSHRTLYIFDELRCIKTSNEDVWGRLVSEKGVTQQDLITADSAEQKSIADFRSYGSNCRGAEKGPNSIRYGMKWLQSLNQIIIDPKRCPNTYREFMEYEYELTKDGDPTSNFVDDNNHCLTGETLVATTNGLKPIKDLVGTEGKLYSYDITNKKVVETEYCNCRKTLKHQQIYEIELENGEKLHCTYDHPILTSNRGYVKAVNLTENDDIISINL